MKNKLKRYHWPPPRFLWLRRLFVSVVMVVLLQNTTSAQNFTVNGTVNNTGKIRVKNQTIIAQPNVGGEIELTGADQNLPAKNYNTIRLLGSGTKTTTGGNLSISGNLTIASPVTLQIQQGSVISLGDTLFESGILKGAIQKSVDLTGSTTSSNFGNIGATVSWSSSAPGITNVLRASDSMQIANGYQSVKRFYRVAPSDTTAIGTVMFKFSDFELNGHDTLILELWQSNDNGNSWKRRPAVVDAINRTISKSNVPIAGMWALADTTRPLGPLSAAGVPAYFTTLQIPPPQSILTQLQPFTVIITDAFGDPIANIPVSFAITSKPVNTSGDTLNTYSAMTDSVGRASTRLTLGNKVGTYSITATSPTLNPIVTNVKALAGTPSIIAQVSGNNQSDTLLTQVGLPLIVSVRDIGDNPIESTMVYFAITSAPVKSTGSVLSNDSLLTDSLGNASISVLLGNKPGVYVITSTSASLPPSVFTLNAIKNSPAIIARVSANNRSDTILTVLDSAFVVSVKDVRGNPVDSALMQFSITSFPQGATGQNLNTPNVATDTNGVAVVTFTIGDKVGPYVVTGSLSGFGISPISYTTNALRGAARSIQLIAGTSQSGTVLSQLPQPFVVSLEDIGGNAVDGDTVFFSFISVPPGATQHQLSTTTAISGINGLASTQLTLGEKAGDYIVGATTPKIAGTQTMISNATPGVAKTFSSISGGGQSGTINSTLTNTMSVTIIDAQGNGIPNRPVTFTISSTPENATGQTLTVSNVTTNASGSAGTQLRLGNKVGIYSVTAVTAGISDTILHASASAGAASTLLAAMGQQQRQPINTQLDTPFVVNVLDIGSNNVPGSMVQFTLVSTPSGSTGSMLSDTLVQSDSLGLARTYFRLGNKVGMYQVKAMVVPSPLNENRSDGEVIHRKSVFDRAANLETNFFASAVHGAAAAFVQITGTGQTKPTEAMLDNAFSLFVTDAGSNLIPNTPVSFRITAAPNNAQGQNLSDTLVFSDSSGFASTRLVLGDLEGLYTITASVNGIVTTQFSATAYYLYGDVNKDIDINVADITTYIDYLLRARTFSIADSIKADINKDGAIDFIDIDSLKEYLLTKPIPALFLLSEELEGVPRIASIQSSSTKPQKVQWYQFADASLEATSLGLRVNLDNDITVRGVEMRVRMKDTIAAPGAINLQFTRAKIMDVFVRTDGNEMRLVAFDKANVGIASGTGPIFRLSNITNDADIDTVQIILSVEANVAVQPLYRKTTAIVGQYPLKFSLKQNYPNPFNGTTTIIYAIPDGQRLIKSLVQVYNVLGQKVKTLVSHEHDPGTYKITWDGTDESGIAVSSGVYFYRLITKEYSTARKMLYVK